MADDVEVKLGADVGDLKNNTENAASSVEASLAKIGAALELLSQKSQKTHDAVTKHTEGLAALFAAFHENIRVRFGSINNIFEQFSTKLETIGAIFAGGALFKGAIDSMLNLEDSVRGLVLSFGLTTQAATQLSVALKLAGISSDTYEQMAQRVGRVLKMQHEEFDRLKITYKDASGALLPMDQILQNVYKRMLDFKEGTDQQMVAMTAIGRNAKDFKSDMERLNTVTAEAISVQTRLGIQMGPERIAQIEAYRVSLNETKLIFEEIGTQIGITALPKLQALSDWFAVYGPKSIEYIIDGVKLFISALHVLGGVLASIGVYGVNAFQKIGIEVRAAAQAYNQWWNAVSIFQKADEQIEALNKAAADSYVDIWKDARMRVGDLWKDAANPEYWGGEAKRGQKSTGGKGTEDFPFKATGDKPDVTAGLENELKAEEDAYNKRMLDQGSFQTWSITQTRDYWEEVLSISDLSFKDRQAAENKYYDAERQVQVQAYVNYMAGLEAQKAALGANIQAKIALQQKEIDAAVEKYGEQDARAQAEYKKMAELQKEAYKQTEDLAKDHAKFMIDMATQESTAEQDNLQFQIDMRQVAADKKFGLETDLENKLYALKRQEMQNELALVAQDPIAYQKVYEQIELLDQQHQQKLTAIDHAATLDRRKDELQATQDFQDDFSSAIASVADGTKSLKNAFLDFFKSLDQQLSKIAADQIAKQLFGPGTGANNFLSGIFGKIFGGGAAGAGAGGDAAATAAHTTALAADTTAITTNTSLLSPALTALTSAAYTAAAALNSTAGGGAAGGFSSIFGGAFDSSGAGIGFGSAIASFDVGTPYVPQDTLAVVHKGEAIIPAAMNRGGAVSTGPMHMHFYISGNPDSRTLDQIQAAAARGASKSTRSVM